MCSFRRHLLDVVDRTFGFGWMTGWIRGGVVLWCGEVTRWCIDFAASYSTHINHKTDAPCGQYEYLLQCEPCAVFLSLSLSVYLAFSLSALLRFTGYASVYLSACLPAGLTGCVHDRGFAIFVLFKFDTVPQTAIRQNAGKCER